MDVSSGNWENIHTWLPLAKLFRDLDFGCALDTYTIPTKPYDFPQRNLHSQINGTPCQLVKALNEVARLGLQAREEGWRTDAKLKKEFEKWMDRVVSTGGKYAPIMVGRLRRWEVRQDLEGLKCFRKGKASTSRPYYYRVEKAKPCRKKPDPAKLQAAKEWRERSKLQRLAVEVESVTGAMIKTEDDEMELEDAFA
jgi:hypothetical protein